jgi:hypothetical protein
VLTATGGTLMTVASPASTRIRPFTADDIPAVADLHRKVFGLAAELSPELLESYRVYFTSVYLANPCQELDGGSLVYEEGNGRITGFLAMAARRMLFNGRPIRARITSQFVVEPKSRGMAGFQLLKSALAGDQDITIADESNSDSRMLWEGLGGVTSHLYSMRWIYPLRPCQFGLRLLGRKGILPGFATGASMPLARALDGLAGRIMNRLSGRPAPALSAQPLTCETLLACLKDAGKKLPLRVDHDARSLDWLLTRAESLRSNGRLQKALLRTDKQEIAGWYLYYVNPAGFSEVIQIHARPDLAPAVLNHLFEDARAKGVTALSGRMQPAMTQAFSQAHCLFHCGPQWVLAHSRRPELQHAFDRGNIGFSRLDGEWCLHFR